jgi:hypothetical protein
MFDSDFMEIIGKGNREEAIRKLKLFAANYVGAINAPGVSGNPSVYLPSDPRVFMDKLVGVTKKFKDIDGVNSFMTEATKALGSQEGIWHVLRNVESLDPKTVSRFDAKFVNTDRPCVECRFDVEMIKGEGQPLKFIEYKSYIAADKIDVPQLLNYLNGVADLSELRYVFAADKLSLEKAKEGMLAVFRKNAESIWEANEILFKGKPIKINDQDYLIMELSDFTDILNHKDALKCSIFDFVTRQ